MSRGASCNRFVRQAGAQMWAESRIGPLLSTTTRSPVTVTPHSRSDHRKHLGYVAVLGIAAGMLALVCFYFCMWLVRQSRQRALPDVLAPSPDLEGGDGAGWVVDQNEKTEGRPTDGAGDQRTWNAGAVELVLMAGELVPTFVAHPATPN